MKHTPARLAVVGWVAALAVLCSAVPAARGQVRDDARVFGSSAVADANRAMGQLEQKFHKQLVVDTIPSLPADAKAALQQQTKDAVFKRVTDARASAARVNGVYVLICMDPKYIDVAAGRETISRGIFTEDDVSQLKQQVRSTLAAGQPDRALREAIDTVERTYTTNIPGTAPRQASNNAPAARSSAVPANRAPAANRDSTPPANEPASGGGMVKKLGCGTILCVGIAAVIAFGLIRRMLSNRGGPTSGPGGAGGGGFGGGPTYPTGGPGYGGGVQQQQGGGGFGKGLLGGLLGGAVGGYAADRFMHGHDAGAGGGGVAPSSDAGDTGGGGYSGGGFDSGPSDAGQGFGDSASGSDFGGGGGDSGGGDFGGGGGDSGGGDSGGF